LLGKRAANAGIFFARVHETQPAEIVLFERAKAGITLPNDGRHRWLVIARALIRLRMIQTEEVADLVREDRAQIELAPDGTTSRGIDEQVEIFVDFDDHRLDQPITERVHRRGQCDHCSIASVLSPFGFHENNLIHIERRSSDADLTFVGKTDV
jgi:hypothetical protein